MATSINFTHFKNRYGSSAAVVPYIKDGDAFYVQTKCTASAPFHVDRVIVTKSCVQLPDSAKNLPDKCVITGVFMSDNPALNNRQFMAEASVRTTETCHEPEVSTKINGPADVEVTFTFMDDADHIDEDDETSSQHMTSTCMHQCITQRSVHQTKRIAQQSTSAI